MTPKTIDFWPQFFPQSACIFVTLVFVDKIKYPLFIIELNKFDSCQSVFEVLGGKHQCSNLKDEAFMFYYEFVLIPDNEAYTDTLIPLWDTLSFSRHSIQRDLGTRITLCLFYSGDVILPVNVFSHSSIHRAGAVFSQQLITVNGKMTWTIGWSQRVISQKTVDKFINIMFETLNNAVNQWFCKVLSPLRFCHI